MSRLLLVLIGFFSLTSHAIEIIPPEINASSHYLMDFTTGKVLAENNADAKVEPASLTKMMTVYVALKAIADGTINIHDDVLISKKAWQTGGSKTFIEVGDKIPVDTLLKGIIIQSGNDASVAIAEHIGGSEDAFAQIMNQEAKRLGMINSHFMNATGLPHPEHLTTAHDMAILARALIKDFPEHYHIHAQKEFTYNDIKQYNRNRLLWQDKTVDGIKTGHTQSAGYCLVSSAVRDDMRVIAVVMGTESGKQRIQESRKLLNFAFLRYKTHQLYSTDDVIKEVKVWYADKDKVTLNPMHDVFVTIPKGQYKNLKAKLELDTKDGLITAPLKDKQSMGHITVKLDDELITTVPVVTHEAIHESGLIDSLFDKITLFIQGFFEEKDVL